MTSANKHIIVLSVVLSVACSLAAPIAAQTPDTTAAGNTVQPFRGTDAPLERDASAAQWAGHVVLAVPYAGLAIATWPIYQSVRINERYKILQRLAEISLFRQGETEVNAFFGFESGIGISLAGLEATTKGFLIDGSEFVARGGYFSPDRNIISVRYRTPPRTIQLSVLGRLRNKENRPFYGLGPDTPDIKFAADRRRLLFETSINIRARKALNGILTGYYRKTDLSDSSSETPVAIGFPGLFARAEESEYIGAEVSLIYDERNRAAFSTKGVLVCLNSGYNSAQSTGDVSYLHYDAEIQAFVNLYQQTRTLALRAFAEGIDGSDLAALPYNELGRLGGKTGMRGYDRYRFTGNTLLVLTAEYRYRVTEFVIGQLLVDWGSVASGWEDMKLSATDPSYGFGLILGRTSGRRLVFHVAQGKNSTQFYLGTERVFTHKSRRRR